MICKIRKERDQKLSNNQDTEWATKYLVTIPLLTIKSSQT